MPRHQPIPPIQIQLRNKISMVYLLLVVDKRNYQERSLSQMNHEIHTIIHHLLLPQLPANGVKEVSNVQTVKRISGSDAVRVRETKAETQMAATLAWILETQSLVRGITQIAAGARSYRMPLRGESKPSRLLLYTKVQLPIVLQDIKVDHDSLLETNKEQRQEWGTQNNNSIAINTNSAATQVKVE